MSISRIVMCVDESGRGGWTCARSKVHDILRAESGVGDRCALATVRGTPVKIRVS